VPWKPVSQKRSRIHQSSRDYPIHFLSQKFNQIRSRKLFRLDHNLGKFLEILYLLLIAPWVLPTVLLIRCLRPWRIIRLSFFPSDGIGHFVLDAGIHWSMRQQQSSRQYLDLYYFNGSQISNAFWGKMVRRNFSVYPWWLLRPLDLWNRVLPGGDIHRLPPPIVTTRSHDIHGWLDKSHGNMSFLPEEDAQAKAWLQRQGWHEGEPFVCLLVRDAAYRGQQGGDQDFRNSDIATYVVAAEWLAEQDVWVLRMGKQMAKPMPTNHHHIIDYAFHPKKSDFLDIWLFAHCDLCISTGSGAECISNVYCRPQLVLNYTPLTALVSWGAAMYLPKTLVWKNSGVPLTLREYLNNVPEMAQVKTGFFAQAGIRIIDLTPEQILEAVQERWYRLQGNWVDTEADRKRNNRFWKILREYSTFNKYHGWIHPECRVGATWLRSMGDDFLA
jgi:putative glycosyltransferase (TIGR04372 family)